MTNFEKYKKDISYIAKNDAKIAVSKKSLKPQYCIDTECTQCLFHSEACDTALIKWFCQEYQDPAPKLTKKERAFCEIVKDGYIARDKNRGLAYHSNLPEYYDSSEYWVPDFSIVKISRQYFNFITCEPGKAWSIEDLLKLEVE